MKQDRGYTLVELLIALAISAVIFVAAAAVLFQLTTVSSSGNDRLSAVHAVQNAGYWFNRDGQEAVSAAAGASLVFTLPQGQTVTYALTGNSLSRSEGAAAIVLAGNVSNLSFSIQGRLVSMGITSTISGRTDVSESSNYAVYLRPVLP
jgi:prepilin-type N-terminal cleavage/methylation domain-containing protein